MSEKKTEGSNVLPFKRIAKGISSTAAAELAVVELQELLVVYDGLIALLRETDSDGLDILADDLVVAVVACRAALTNEMDDKTSRKMLSDMRNGLREIPQILRSLLPGLGPRLGESMEHKLGIRFSKY